MQRFDQLRSLLVRLAATGDPWDRLNALAHLRRELDAAETELAADALHAGFTWSQIGEALGISKQAAHRRHSHSVAKLDQAAQTEHAGRNVIVSAEARQAVRVARREAATLGETRVGTEHLLLGLLQCGDRTTERLLERLGVTLEAARDAVQPTLEATAAAVATAAAESGPADTTSAASSLTATTTTTAPAAPSPVIAVAPPARGGSALRRSATVSPLARRILERALNGMQRHSSDTLSALDLLRAVLRDDKGGAARTLTMLGVDAERVREEITRLDEVIIPPP